jgi:sulfate permease, SulP family
VAAAAIGALTILFRRQHHHRAMPDGAATAHLLRPKLVTILKEGYDLARFRRDAIAGATVAVVALPLSMAIAVASGVSPERGLYTAIVGGFIVSALSGSRFQIGGPAGAFITLMAATVVQLGLNGLIVAVLMSGAMLALLGLLRIGSLVRHIPHAVTVGFTCGIAVIILASQLKDLGGLTLAGVEPGPFIPKLAALGQAFASLNPIALALGVVSIAIIFGLRRWKPNWPGMLVAVLVTSVAAVLLNLPVETIGARFGGIPSGVPAPALPALSPATIMAALPAALSFTLLGAIESLLSAKVADGMTGRKHRSNMELIGQGAANMASALFGGICVTGTIARTATNIRAGAATPIAGIMHAAFLLLFMIVAAPLASFIPMAALAGVLVAVAWTMAERQEFARLTHAWPSALVLVVTLALTLLFDLIAGIAAGCIVAAILAALRRATLEGA